LRRSSSPALSFSLPLSSLEEDEELLPLRSSRR
jgi:hypothetical protein